jgi:hypothetical protein
MWPWSTIRQLRWRLELQSDSILQRNLGHAEAQLKSMIADRNWYKGLLYDAWKNTRAQQKGMNRMSRKIRRLQAEVKRLSTKE